MVLSSMPKASTAFFTWPWVFYGQLLLFTPIFWLGFRLATRFVIGRNSWYALGALTLAIAVSVAFSRRPSFSVEAALFLFSGLAWSGVVSLETSSDDASSFTTLQLRRLARFVGAAFAMSLFAGLFFWIEQGWMSARSSNSGVFQTVVNLRNQHPLGHWNFTGGFAILALPWFAALIVQEHGRWRAMWLCCAAIGCVMLFSSYSRGAILGAITAAAAVFASALFNNKISRKRSSLIIIAALIMIGGLWTTNGRLRALVTHPASILQPSEGDIQRIGMMQGGWLLALQRPWIGHGPGMTPFVYPVVRAQLVGGVETSFQLHNGPLQLWVDHGAFGFVCVIAFAVILLRNALRWLKSPPTPLRTFALASAYSLIGYSVMFVTDYQLNVLAFVAALGLQAGLVLAAPVKNKTVAPRVARWAGSAIMAAGVVILAVLIPAWRARQTFWTAWETNLPAETLSRLQRTVEIAPHNPYYLNQLALRRARLAEKTPDPTAAAALRTQARAELSRSLTLDPAQEPVHAALGWLWLSENPKQAEAHFRAAIALLPDRDTVHLGLALSRLAQGDQPGTVRELSLECLVNPIFIASPLWAQEPLLSLRVSTTERLFNDYAFAIQHQDTPAWRKSHLVYATAFIRWWLGGSTPNETELVGALPYQRQFFEQLPTLHKIPLSAQSSTWELLDQARQDPSRADVILRSSINLPSNEAIVGALARLAAKPATLSNLLRSSAPNGIGIVIRQINRGHYSIMNCILDGPGYEDLAPRYIDAFATEYAGPLFPMRSAIPGPVLIALEAIPGN
jgi:O-antigen ligase